MTQDEAKAKWCPFALVSTLGAKHSFNRVREDPEQPPLASRCIASACMAWRWRDFPKRDHGYCGMAERT